MVRSKALQQLTACCALLTLALGADAASLRGGFGFIGTVVSDTGNLEQTTQLSDFQIDLVVPALQDFAGTSDLSIDDFSVDPLGVFSFVTSTGISFTGSEAVIQIETPSQLSFSVFGTFSAPGFDDTPGTVNFGATGFDADRFSLSGQAFVVPVPPAGMLLASALGMAGFARRRRRL